MALTAFDRRAIAVAAVLAVAMPATVLLAPLHAPNPAPPMPSAAVPIEPPPLGTALARPLFDAAAVAEPAPADAPELLGIAGRLNRDAVALVRGAGGATRALAIGDSIDGWQLRAIAIDAAYFTRGTQQARVPMPGGDDADQ